MADSYGFYRMMTLKIRSWSPKPNQLEPRSPNNVSMKVWSKSDPSTGSEDRSNAGNPILDISSAGRCDLENKVKVTNI